VQEIRGRKVHIRKDGALYCEGAGGVGYAVPMLGPVPVALDFGFPVVKTPQENAQVFSFFMGFFR
jgi:outer membrane protein insertion porin family